MNKLPDVYKLLIEGQKTKDNNDAQSEESDLYWEFSLLRHYFGLDPGELTWEQVRGYLARVERIISLSTPVSEETHQDMTEEYKELLKIEK